MWDNFLKYCFAILVFILPFFQADRWDFVFSSWLWRSLWFIKAEITFVLILSLIFPEASDFWRNHPRGGEGGGIRILLKEAGIFLLTWKGVGVDRPLKKMWPTPSSPSTLEGGSTPEGNGCGTLEGLDSNHQAPQEQRWHWVSALARKKLQTYPPLVRHPAWYRHQGSMWWLKERAFWLLYKPSNLLYGPREREGGREFHPQTHLYNDKNWISSYWGAVRFGHGFDLL